MTLREAPYARNGCARRAGGGLHAPGIGRIGGEEQLVIVAARGKAGAKARIPGSESGRIGNLNPQSALKKKS